MIAIPRRSIWMPSRVFDPLAMFAFNGKRLMRNGRRQMRSGKRLMTTDCCLFQARDCATNTLQSLYVKKSSFPSYPSTWYFKTSGGACMYVQSSDTAPCNSTPVISSGMTSYASCAACTGGGGTGCPTYGLPTTYSVGGLSGGFPLCNAAPHTGTPPCFWDFTLNNTGTQWTITNCVTLGANSYFPVTGGSGYTTGWAILGCGGPGVTPPPSPGYWWCLELTYALANSGCPDGIGSAVADYYMAAFPTSGAAGTYTLAGVVAACDSGAALTCSMPGTLTVS